MTLRMADGPVANLPEGMDAYAGYVDMSGIGVTFPAVVARFPTARHLSIATHGNRAECADVENGAMRTWAAYTVGYCAVSNAKRLISLIGRPTKLWTAHYDWPKAPGRAHICGPTTCGNVQADGTQWIDHGGWDESLLFDDFFSFQDPKSKEYQIMDSVVAPNGDIVSHAVTTEGHYLEITRFADEQGKAASAGTVSIVDMTAVWPQFVVSP